MLSTFRGCVLPCLQRRRRRALPVAAARLSGLVLMMMVLVAGCKLRLSPAKHSGPASAATLTLNSTNLPFSFNQGETTPSTVQLVITKSPAGPLRWRADFDLILFGQPKGLSLSATAGQVSGTTDTLTVSFNPTGSTTSSGFGLITITDLDTGITTDCRVTVRIQPESGPVFTDGPTGITVNPGDRTVFHAGVAGKGPLTLQWQRNGVDLPGATTDTLIVENPTLADSGTVFQLIGVNPIGTAVSPPAVLTVRSLPQPPTLQVSPSDRTVTGYETTTFSCHVSSYLHADVQYQWLFNGVEIFGATANSYGLPVAYPSMTGAQIQVRVSNHGGSTLSAPATLTVLPVVDPFFYNHPANTTVMVGDQFELEARLARFYTGVTWQWQKNGVDLPGQTKSRMTGGPATFADTGASFRVIIHTPAGTYVSDSATLTVVPAEPPSLEPLYNYTTYEGNFVDLYTYPNGSVYEPTTFQWQKNGVDLPNETNFILYLHPATLADNGCQFGVVATNPAGSSSTTMTLTVLPRAPVGQIVPNSLSFKTFATNPNWFSGSTVLANLNQSGGYWRPGISATAPWLKIFPSTGGATVANCGVFATACQPVDQWEYFLGTTQYSAPNELWTGSDILHFQFYNPPEIGCRQNLDGTYSIPITDTHAPDFKLGGTGIWTGSEAILWGGGTSFFLKLPTNSGYRYDPVTNAWRGAIALNGAPTARGWHCAVWTGTEMIVWGGTDGTTPQNTGARYNPVTNSWTPMTVTGAPSARYGASAVWTGSRMIVWGGRQNDMLLNDGALYDPATDTWTGITAATGAPAPRAFHAAAWSGAEMYIAAGDRSNNDAAADILLDGARYNPATDTWTPLPTPLNPVFSDHNQFWGFWAGNKFVLRAGNRLYGFYGPSIALTEAFCLTPGVYTDTVIFDDPNAINGPQTLTVTLTVTGSPAVVNIDPPHLAYDVNPTQVTIEFTMPIDAATVTSANVVLEASGGDNNFTNGNETVIVPTALNLTDPTHLQIDLSSIPLAPDNYRVTLKSGLQSIFGYSLDGENTGNYPSGNGTAGGDFVSFFDVGN